MVYKKGSSYSTIVHGNVYPMKTPAPQETVIRGAKKQRLEATSQPKWLVKEGLAL